MFDIGHFRAPRPVGRAADEAGADGVHADVIERAVVVLLISDGPGFEALAKQGSDALVDGIVLPGVGAVCAVHGVGEVLGAA